jgi:hypothetical protein
MRFEHLKPLSKPESLSLRFLAAVAKGGSVVGPTVTFAARPTGAFGRAIGDQTEWYEDNLSFASSLMALLSRTGH